MSELTFSPDDMNKTYGSEAVFTQNIDNCFYRFTSQFTDEETAEAALAVQEGWDGEHGLAGYLEQRKLRCVLKGQIHNQSDGIADWGALFSLVYSDPKPGKPKNCPLVVFWPDAC
jgi:hypothetical protein